MVRLTAPVGTTGILTGVDDGIGWIAFDQPERLNAFSPEMGEALDAVVDQMESDPGVRVVVARGAGDRAFISGADLSRMGEPRRRGAGGGAPQRPDRGIAALRRFTKPTVAMIHGWCLGGGLLVAMSTDLRIAGDDARFGVPAGKLGIAYPLWGVDALVQLVGPAHANEMLLTGERMDADEACRVGLVNRVVPKQELEAAVSRLAATIAGNAPLSLRASKASVRYVAGHGAEDDLTAVEALVEACSASEDFAEGRAAFADKRAPVFQGR